MEELPKGESRNIKFLKLLLKIAVTLVCLWYVSKKIDFSKAGQALQNAKVIYLFLALIAFIISKWISAIRLQLYFATLFVTAQEVALVAGMRISKSTRIKKAVYRLDAPHDFTGAAIVVEGNNITIDFKNAELKGSRYAKTPSSLTHFVRRLRGNF